MLGDVSTGVEVFGVDAISTDEIMEGDSIVALEEGMILFLADPSKGMEKSLF